MTKIDPQEFEEQRNKLVSGLAACAEQLRNTAKVVEDFAQLISGLDGEVKGKRKELVFDTDADVDPEGSKKRKRIIKPKDPNAPKRPPSSYILFQNEIRAELRQRNPELTNPQLLAMISEKWKTMPEEEKARYNEKMRTAKAQYSEDKKAYDARSPEEVEAANRALAESVALKKANRGGRKKAAPVAAPVLQAKSEEPESDEEQEQEHEPEVETAETDEESEEESAPVAAKSKNAKQQESSDSDEESGSEEEEEEVAPPAKRTKRAGSAQPKSKKNKA